MFSCIYVFCVLLWPLKLVGITCICFSWMPCLESKNNDFLYVLPQVSYSPCAFYIPVALTSKVLTVNERNSARHRFTSGGILQPGPSPSQELCGQPCHLTWLQPGSFAGTSSPHPSSAAKSDPDCELKMMHLCGWISSNTINLWFMMQYIWTCMHMRKPEA